MLTEDTEWIEDGSDALQIEGDADFWTDLYETIRDQIFAGLCVHYDNQPDGSIVETWLPEPETLPEYVLLTPTQDGVHVQLKLPAQNTSTLVRMESEGAFEYSPPTNTAAEQVWLALQKSRDSIRHFWKWN